MSVETKEWTFDRAGWRNRPGPWDNEPDKRQWQDPDTGYACLIVRNRRGSLCGYVGVPAEHPWHGVGCAAVDESTGYQLTVHGGLTYSGSCSGKICHVVEGDDHVWWLGFDCGHYGDLSPFDLSAALGMDWPADPGEVYRDLDYVIAQVTKLAKQARRAAQEDT